MNHARVDKTLGEHTMTVQEKDLDPVKFWSPGPHPHAQVSMTAGRAMAYGELKISCTITLECDQTKEALFGTAWEAYMLAIDFTNQAFAAEVAKLQEQPT